MDEFFLHYLWKFQKFEGRPFRLTNGSILKVFYPGHENNNAGPDFLEAKIQIDEIEWVGAVEIHHKASDWLIHNHQQDKKYDGVILHVVWIADKDIQLSDQSTLPMFKMSDYQNGSLEADYRKYINQPVTIKCASFLPQINTLTKTNMLDQALIERLSMKSQLILEEVRLCKGDWEKITFLWLAKNFGFSVNKQAFETWSMSFDYTLLHRYANQQDKCYGIAFGQAGFLEANINDPYLEKLQTEYSHLKRKHQLEKGLERHHWKFSRLRPANFPTVRMAEYITLFCHSENLFAKMISLKTVSSLIKLFKIDLPDYWKHHYDFGKPLNNRVNNLGKASIEVLIINTIAPLLAAYSRYVDEQEYMDRAVQFLSDLPNETNKITKQWSDVGMPPKNAADSQALIHRHQYYCTKKRCLNCNIGIAILHNR